MPPRLSAIKIAVTVLLLHLPVAQCNMDDGICDETIAVSEKEIKDYIFANYSKEVRPRKNASKPLEVSLSLRISAIHDLVERENTLILDGYIFLWWMDDYLAWNNEFPLSCFNQIIVPPGYTWLPDLSIVNSPNGMYALMTEPGFTIQVFSDGSTYFAPGGQIVSKGEVDVTYFPFDKQVCQVHFESWNYDSTTPKYVLDESRPFMKIANSWTENRQWHIEANYSHIKKVTYFDPQYHYYHAAFTLVLRRKSMFYYINIIVPSLIISVVELATFVLPIDEVIKVHISFTCLLAYSVFQGMVIADLPRSGDSVPMLSLYIDLQMAYIGLIALMGESVVFLVIRKAELKKDKPAKKVLRAVRILAKGFFVEFHAFNWEDDPVKEKSPFLDRLAAYSQQMFFSIYQWHDSHHKPVPLSEGLGSNSSKASKEKEGEQINLDSISAGKEIRRQWFFIAEVIERFNMFMYIAAITLTPVIMFNMIPTETDAKEVAFAE